MKGPDLGTPLGRALLYGENKRVQLEQEVIHGVAVCLRGPLGAIQEEVLWVSTGSQILGHVGHHASTGHLGQQLLQHIRHISWLCHVGDRPCAGMRSPRQGDVYSVGACCTQLGEHCVQRQLCTAAKEPSNSNSTKVNDKVQHGARGKHGVRNASVSCWGA